MDTVTNQPHFRLDIDQTKCDRCASLPQPICTEACPKDAIYPCVNSDYVWALCDLSRSPDLCRKCVDACPKKAIKIREVPQLELADRAAAYFKTPGIQNTELVTGLIADHLAEEDIESVVVASCSGSSALMLAEALKNCAVGIVNVTPPAKAWDTIGWHGIPRFMVESLSKLGVVCREFRVADEKNLGAFPPNSRFYDPMSRTSYDIEHLDRVFYETLIDVGGQGLKAAVECTLSACASGDVAEGEIVIATAGSGRGLDTAAVIRATTPDKCFSEKPSERLEVREILAMPLKKQRWR